MLFSTAKMSFSDKASMSFFDEVEELFDKVSSTKIQNIIEQYQNIIDEVDKDTDEMNDLELEDYYGNLDALIGDLCDDVEEATKLYDSNMQCFMNFTRCRDILSDLMEKRIV
jgi:hypothetical protein